jgi:hypothetical protein
MGTQNPIKVFYTSLLIGDHARLKELIYTPKKIIANLFFTYAIDAYKRRR